MQPRLLSTVLAPVGIAVALSPASHGGASSAALAAAPSSKPSAAQIRAAVARAEKSPNLWATINACNIRSRRHRGEKLLGIRVQMPGLGFTTRLYMSVRIQYFSTTAKRYLNTDSRFGPAAFSLSRRAAHQSGVEFAFTSPSKGGDFTLRGVATLEWRVGSKVLGRVVRNTGGGHRNVDSSTPPGYTAGSCRITA